MRKKETFSKKNIWIYMGICWGIFMYFIMVVAIPYFRQELISRESILIGIPVWILGGLLYGYSMKRYLDREQLKK